MPEWTLLRTQTPATMHPTVRLTPDFPFSSGSATHRDIAAGSSEDLESRFALLASGIDRETMERWAALGQGGARWLVARIERESDARRLACAVSLLGRLGEMSMPWIASALVYTQSGNETFLRSLLAAAAANPAAANFRAWSLNASERGACSQDPSVRAASYALALRFDGAETESLIRRASQGETDPGLGVMLGKEGSLRSAWLNDCDRLENETAVENWDGERGLAIWRSQWALARLFVERAHFKLPQLPLPLLGASGDASVHLTWAHPTRGRLVIEIGRDAWWCSRLGESDDDDEVDWVLDVTHALEILTAWWR